MPATVKTIKTVQELIDILSALSETEKAQKPVINASGEPFDIKGIDVADGLIWIETDS